MISTQYAIALFELSNEYQDDILDDLSSFVTLLNDVEIDRFLKSPSIPVDKKKGILKEFLIGINKLVIDFIFVLLDNGRISMMREIASEFNRLVIEKKGIVYIDVHTAESLTKEQRDELIEELANHFTGEIRINNIIDKRVLGGMRIEHDGISIDQTLRTQLHTMKALI